jgi:hypothetical protein
MPEHVIVHAFVCIIFIAQKSPYEQQDLLKEEICPLQSQCLDSDIRKAMELLN